MNHRTHPVTGAGLGLRRALLGPLQAFDPEILGGAVSFMEVAPENWINVGGQRRKFFNYFTDNFPFVCHGLSLSIGGPSPLDRTFIQKLRQFMDDYQIRAYSEHLSYCTDDGHLYDLMPIPFTEDAVRYVADRVRRVQDILEQRIALENVSYYAPTDSSMTEKQFLLAVLEEADCDLMLDINNIVVNSINHRYDASDFLRDMPADRIRYFHLAGHHVEDQDLRIDTHGSAVDAQAWQLLEDAYKRFGPVPTLLERDFNFPPMEELLDEVRQIKRLQQNYQTPDARHG